jgi:peptidoglycan/LPS O-acetylase OafA/YrhL
MLYFAGLMIPYFGRPDKPSMDKDKPAEFRLAALDTVRGLAALSVVVSHYILAYGLPTQSQLWRQAWKYTPLHILWDGSGAVSLFFVLSGLVLSLKYFRDAKRADMTHFRYGVYLIGRIFRIWPPYLAIFLLSALLQRTLGASGAATVPAATRWLSPAWVGSLPLAGYVRESLLLQWDNYFLVPQAWTLPVEMLVSFLVPIGIFLISLNTFWLIAAVLVAVLALGCTYFTFHFMGGQMIAKYYREIRAFLENRRWLRWVVLLVGIFLYTFRFTLPIYWGWTLSEGTLMTVSGLGSMCILSYVIGSNRAQATLSLPWLRFLGKVSFSIYLVHFLVMMVFTSRFLSLLGATEVMAIPVWWAGFAVTIALTMLGATISYRLFEAPSMAAGKWIARSLRVGV